MARVVCSGAYDRFYRFCRNAPAHIHIAALHQTLVQARKDVVDSRGSLSHPPSTPLVKRRLCLALLNGSSQSSRPERGVRRAAEPLSHPALLLHPRSRPKHERDAHRSRSEDVHSSGQRKSPRRTGKDDHGAAAQLLRHREPGRARRRLETRLRRVRSSEVALRRSGDTSRAGSLSALSGRSAQAARHEAQSRTR